jgi:hypothetical protein
VNCQIRESNPHQKKERRDGAISNVSQRPETFDMLKARERGKKQFNEQ